MVVLSADNMEPLNDVCRLSVVNIDLCTLEFSFYD